MGIGVLLGSLVATATKPRRPLVVYSATTAAFAVPLALLAVPTSVALIAGGALLAGAALALGNSVWESTLQRHIPREALSRVSSYDWFASSALQPIGLAVWGPIAVVVGFGTALWAAAAILIVMTFTLLAVPDIRRLPASPP
jgi:hypothetical protein